MTLLNNYKCYTRLIASLQLNTCLLYSSHFIQYNLRTCVSNYTIRSTYQILISNNCSKHIYTLHTTCTYVLYIMCTCVLINLFKLSLTDSISVKYYPLWFVPCFMIELYQHTFDHSSQLINLKYLLH